MQVKIKKVQPEAIIPFYATAGAACFDLSFVGEVEYAHNGDAILKTGLAFEVPEGHVMMVYSRSGHGFKYNVTLANGTGVIDSDYRGEVAVKLISLTPNGQDLLDNLRAGDRIAQAMIIPFNQVSFIETDELSETDRGEGGFGSTGK